MDKPGLATIDCVVAFGQWYGMPVAEDMDITTEMITTINAQYRAKTSTGSSISIEITDIPRDIHLMVVWALNHPEAAQDLIPRYYQARAEHEAHDEGSAKNHGIEP